MSEGKILDIAHISFLEMIKVLIDVTGAPSAKGNLVRMAISAADSIDIVNYPSFDHYLAAIEDTTNPITRVEGKSSHVGDFVFGLSQCPFAHSIGNYTNVFGGLPEAYKDYTAEYNKPSRWSKEYHVGQGSGVSPFCSVHQPMRSALADRITIDGKKIKIYQLGCKSGSGVKALAEDWLEETGVPQEVVNKVLDTNMCCYYLKIMQ